MPATTRSSGMRVRALWTSLIVVRSPLHPLILRFRSIRPAIIQQAAAMANNGTAIAIIDNMTNLFGR